MTGASKADFWTLTPLEILARLERLHFERRWWSLRFAVLVCASGATSKGGSPLTPRDVMENYFDD